MNTAHLLVAAANTNTAPTSTAPVSLVPASFSFEVGKVYVMRSPCDYRDVQQGKVISRTATRVTVLVTTEDGKFPATHTVKIRHDGETEYCQPLGRYSMSPVLSAEKILKQR